MHSPLPRVIIMLMAACCATSVANVYYAQPLLDAVAGEFGLSTAAAGAVITATQLGCALALVFIVPLGDLLNRKTLICTELALLAGTLIAIFLTPSPLLLFAGMVALGLLGTAVTQGMIAYAASLAEPAERGSVIGLVQSGVLVGVLGSRSLAGVVADAAGWREIFAVSALFAMAMLLVCWRYLPKLTVVTTKLRYPQLLFSMLSLLRHERVLQVRGMLGLLVFSVFGAFWSALVLPLRGYPHHLSHTFIGAFGIVGIVGALAAAKAGRLADRGYGEEATGLALICMIASWGFIALLPYSLISLALGVVLLDLGGQAVHVLNQSIIYKTRPELHSRLVGCYMLFYAAGLGLGAVVATHIYSIGGWVAVCWMGLGLSFLALVFWYITQRIK